MLDVFLALGSNIPPKIKYISNATVLLKEQFPEHFQCSSIFETSPYHEIKQESYLNSCVKFKTGMSPFSILEKCQKIEQKIGYVEKKFKWDNRRIDIDILLYGNEYIQTDTLKIPHYDILNRDFFLIPLKELDDKLILPNSNLSLDILIKNIPLKRKTIHLA